MAFNLKAFRVPKDIHFGKHRGDSRRGIGSVTGKSGGEGILESSRVESEEKKTKRVINRWEKQLKYY